ncbi:outer membrane protein [Leptospira interrogans]
MLWPFGGSTMKTTVFGLLVAAGVCAAAPVMAQGVIYKGGSKDGIAHTVPVPAPVPIPDYGARWYLRADLAAGFMSADPSESGIEYGDLYVPQDLTSPFNSGAFARRSGSDTVFNFGGGVGYYWTSRFRTDMTIEGRTPSDLSVSGDYTYTQDDNGLSDRVDGVTRDRTKLTSGLVLFNAYWDFMPRDRFTPYVGAGVGFAVNQLKRSFSNVEAICDGGALPVGDDCFDAGAGGVPLTDETTANTVTFAAAAMAGFSYAITPVTMFDMNYRYLYMGGSDASMSLTPSTRSTFSTGDIHEHQIRAGLRFNIQ